MEPIFKSSWTEIVFEKRNKSYGAYQLRTDYPKHLTIAFFLGITPFASAMLLMSLKNDENALPIKPKETIILVDKKKFELEQKKQLQEGIKPKIKEKQSNSNRITLAQDTLLTSAAAQNPIETTEAGHQGQEQPDGIGSGESGIGTDSITSSGQNITKPTMAIPDTNIRLVVDQQPIFNGNFKQYIAQNFIYPKLAINNGISGKLNIRFVIEADGSITQVKFIGKQLGYGIEEEITRVLTNMPLWKPAVQKGINVRFRFNLPFEVSLSQ